MKHDVYNDLVIDIVSNCGLNMFTARKVVDLLKRESHINHEALVKYYAERQNDEA